MYRGKPYWETEKPRTAEAGAVELRYYPDARRLQVHGRFRADDGTWRTRHVVTVDVEALATSPAAVELLRAVLDDAAEMSAVRPGRAG